MIRNSAVRPARPVLQAVAANTSRRLQQMSSLLLEMCRLCSLVAAATALPHNATSIVVQAHPLFINQSGTRGLLGQVPQQPVQEGVGAATAAAARGAPRPQGDGSRAAAASAPEPGQQAAGAASPAPAPAPGVPHPHPMAAFLQSMAVGVPGGVAPVAMSTATTTTHMQGPGGSATFTSGKGLHH